MTSRPDSLLEKIVATRSAIRNWLLVGFVSRIGRLAGQPLFPRRLGQLINDIPVTVRLRRAGSMRVRIRDLGALYEIFVLPGFDSLGLPADGVRTVIDCGANVGAFTRWMSARNDCRVLAIEPGPSAHEVLARNVAGLAHRVRVVRAAVAATSGVRTLYEPFYSANASLMPQEGQPHGDVRSYDVPSMTMQEVFDISGFERIDMLKVDIEGAEQEVFESIDPRLLARVQAAVIEVHTWGGADQETIAAKLTDAGMNVHAEDTGSATLLVASRNRKRGLRDAILPPAATLVR